MRNSAKRETIGSSSCGMGWVCEMKRWLPSPFPDRPAPTCVMALPRRIFATCHGTGMEEDALCLGYDVLSQRAHQVVCVKMRHSSLRCIPCVVRAAALKDRRFGCCPLRRHRRRRPSHLRQRRKLASLLVVENVPEQHWMRRRRQLLSGAYVHQDSA